LFGTQNVVYWDQSGTSVVENNDLTIGDNLNGHATHTVVMLTAVSVALSRILYALLNTTVMLAYANLHDTYKHWQGRLVPRYASFFGRLRMTTHISENNVSDQQ
jgi:hypothetical protein